MMKLSQLTSLLVVVSFSCLISCSSDDGGDEIDTDTSVTVDTDINNDDTGTDIGGDTGADTGNDDTDLGNVDGGVNTSSLTERFVFDENIYIENSYFEGECERTPCETDDERLDDAFDNGNVPDDVYFSLSEDQSELVLQCLPDLGRRIEFKQRSEGPLDVPASLEMEGVFEDIPDAGITIAQVHNRGAASGNKPFFRLVLFRNGLETVVREKPVVSSRESGFLRPEILFPFVNGGDYDLTPLRIIVSKSDGMVHINVWQGGESILSQSFAPDPSTEWVTDEGISNGFYLKGGIYNDDEENFTENLVARFTEVIFASEDIDEI